MQQSSPFDEFRGYITVDMDLNHPMCPDEFIKTITYDQRVPAIRIRKMGIDPLIIQNEAQLAALVGSTNCIIESRIDPLFGKYSLHTTLISGERANRPGAKKFTREDVRSILEKCLEEGISVQQVIDEYKESIGGSEQRYVRDDIKKVWQIHLDVKLPVPDSIGAYDVATSPIRGACDLCEDRIYDYTALPRFEVPGEPHALIFPNLCPYTSPHYMTVFDMRKKEGHHPDLRDAQEKDMVVFLKTGKQVAKMLRDDEKFRRDDGIGMWDFINWGFTAGASEEHPHAQRGGVYAFMKEHGNTYVGDRILSPSRMFKESKALKKRQNDLDGKDPFEYYMQLIKEAGEWYYEDEHVFVFAPYAPVFTDQVDIFTKSNGRTIHNYLELREESIPSIARSLTKILRILRQERDVTDLNVLTHQGMFDEEGKYRLHWHVLPRMTKLAGMEINDIYVVSCYPEKDTEKKKSTSTVLRENFEKF